MAKITEKQLNPLLQVLAGAVKTVSRAASRYLSSTEGRKAVLDVVAALIEGSPKQVTKEYFTRKLVQRTGISKQAADEIYELTYKTVAKTVRSKRKKPLWLTRIETQNTLVHEWWKSLTPDQRQAISMIPDIRIPL